jgi:MFS family permease
MSRGTSCIVRDIGPSTTPRAAVTRGEAARLRRARVAVAAYLGFLGVADGVWLARIPAVKQHLGLGDGLLGAALLAAPAGLVLVAAIADRLIDRAGSAALTVATAAALPLLLVALGLAGNLAELMAALFGYGLLGGLLDVCLNTQAVGVERGYRRPLINSFHAGYSFGGLLGALLGGLFAWAGVGPLPTFAAVGAPLIAAAVLARGGLLRDQVLGPDDERGSRRDRPGPGAPGGSAPGGSAPRRGGLPLRIVALGLLALCSLLGEGAAGSWSAVYLRDNLATSAGFAALGYAAFSVTMAIGRLLGDRVTARFGPGRMVSGCGLIAAIGLAGALAWPSPAAGLIGFALFGAGLSSTFPQLLSAAGNVATERSGSGIARVAGAGYLGLLAGPVLIGGCASLVGLRLALGIPVVLMLCVAAGGRAAAVRPRDAG